MSVSRYRVMGRLDQAHGAHIGTVLIDRSAGLFMVRRLRCRKSYTLPLSTVADMVALHSVRVEIAEKKRMKKLKKQGKLP